ncbi:uncharacterized protein LOC106641956 [Copidosoma floridanum]|uniref:uncharacterized protein LOC106641956 n=1 Tax=Copidosoma floridanum TaxID=29053 RepID=UPI0006C94E4F|nr:uncharacterized protein LOC106641956 [Copidosoma floridanum]XP_014212037.1 uncharacterized protein LOC106641956 [Copidosoma floridanum]
MEEDYFKNLRTVGTTLDEGIANLQEVWKMPNLLLCKSNEEDQVAAHKLVDNLRSELRQFKELIAENKVEISTLRETHTQFLEESTIAIKNLKDEVDEIKVLFLENGYVEEDCPEPDLSVLTHQLESLSFNNSNPSFVKDCNGAVDSPMCEGASNCDSPMSMRESVAQPATPNNDPYGGVSKRSVMDERLMDSPLYSPYYYKITKK